MKSTFLSFLLFVLFLPGIMANNVTMSNISLCDQNYPNHYCNIKFDISWENSWRASTTVPGNWDACWVFAKYRVNGGAWHHCTLSSNVNDYTSPATCTINPSPDGKGAFIYRAQDGSGNNDWTLLTFQWKYGLDGVNDDAEVEVKLFAIEMVYINEGNFYLGDGNGSLESEKAFHSGTSNNAVQITSLLVPNIQVDNYAPSADYDDAELFDGIGIDGDGGIDPDNNGTIDNAFYPTGYRAFYIMKYEISQDQYKEFLNTLERFQQSSRVATDISGSSTSNVFVMVNSPSADYDNAIRCDANFQSPPVPLIFYCDLNNNGLEEACDGQTLTCNQLNWPDACAYADWAGLRPMSELEFEKAARGPNYPVTWEYAWGNTNISMSGSLITNDGCSNSVIQLSPDQYTGRAYWNYTYITGINLIRCGVFASSSVNHTRQEAGASFYGVMEMSGSMNEQLVCFGNIAGRSFRAINGNGELNAFGDADVDYWPGINGNAESWTPTGIYLGSSGVTQTAGSGAKGGGVSSTNTALQISYRRYTSSDLPLQRQSSNGARFVRYAL